MSSLAKLLLSVSLIHLSCFRRCRSNYINTWHTIVLGCALVFIGVVFLTSSKHTDAGQESGGDMSLSAAGDESDANDSQITTTSLDSEGRLLDGVAITSRRPAMAVNGLSRSPNKAGRVLRKYNSIGMLPSRAESSGSAVATPIRTARTPALATSKLFSPGYLLIAGSGFGNIVNDDTEDLVDLDETNEDLESGLRGASSASGSSSSSAHNIQRGGQETLMDDEGENTRRRQQTQDEDDDCEPMTRSAVMRRSGTV